MTKFLFLIGCSILSISTLIAQENTTIFIMDLQQKDSLKLTNTKKIPTQGGYNNQPSFYNDDTIIFSGTNGNQTDIAWYSISKNTIRWFNTKTAGGEYSPIRIPNSEDIAAVRLDTTGKQRLYRYSKKSGLSTELISEIQVAYYSFFDKDLGYASVLSGSQLDFVRLNFKTQKTDTLSQNSGRSIHKIPNENAISYTIQNEDKNFDVYWHDVTTKEEFFICELPSGIQDYIWINSTQMLLGSGSTVYVYDTMESNSWVKLINLAPYGVTNISRMGISPNQNKIALVSTTNN